MSENEKKYEAACDAIYRIADNEEVALTYGDIDLAKELVAAANFHERLRVMEGRLLVLLSQYMSPRGYCSNGTIHDAKQLLAEIEKEKQV